MAAANINMICALLSASFSPRLFGRGAEMYADKAAAASVRAPTASSNLVPAIRAELQSARKQMRISHSSTRQIRLFRRSHGRSALVAGLRCAAGRAAPRRPTWRASRACPCGGTAAWRCMAATASRAARRGGSGGLGWPWGRSGLIACCQPASGRGALRAVGHRQMTPPGLAQAWPCHGR